MRAQTIARTVTVRTIARGPRDITGRPRDIVAVRADRTEPAQPRFGPPAQPNRGFSAQPSRGLAASQAEAFLPPEAEALRSHRRNRNPAPALYAWPRSVAAARGAVCDGNQRPGARAGRMHSVETGLSDLHPSSVVVCDGLVPALRPKGLQYRRSRATSLPWMRTRSGPKMRVS